MQDNSFLKRSVIVSCMGHGLLLGFLITAGTLLSRPRMSYYSIDLVSSLPAGPMGGGEAPVEAVKTPSTSPAPMPEQSIPKEAIKVPSKTVKKGVVSKKRRPAVTPPSVPKRLSAQQKQALLQKYGSLGKTGDASGQESAVATGVGSGGGGSGLVADTGGQTFPYPWYLKAIADRLDKQWRPPKEFQSDTRCTVAFVIGREGQISNTVVEKASGDTLFDQLALRAVSYSNPMPPLPAGFPEETLRVHMKFVGKPL